MTYVRKLGYDWRQYNVMDYGATGDGTTDDSAAFQACFDAAKAARGKVIIPVPDTQYRIDSTINVKAVAPSYQVFIDVEAHGWGGNGGNCIKYYGANNTACFDITGLKQSIWTGLKVSMNGQTNVQCFNIDTTASTESTSFVTFKNCYLNLGGANSSGWRTGHISGGSADISNYQWENCVVFGSNLSNQIAYLNSGTNTLSQTWIGGFVAQCDRIYSNLSIAGTGATSDRGNGSVFFYGLGGSGNAIDFDFNWEQAYTIIGGRFEAGGSFLKTGYGSYNSAISVINVQINDYTSNYCFDLQTGASMVLDNCRMNKNSGTWTDLVKLDGLGYGTLSIRGGCTKATNLYTRNGGNWKIYIQGVGNASDNNNVNIGSYFSDVTGTVLP